MFTRLVLVLCISLFLQGALAASSNPKIDSFTINVGDVQRFENMLTKWQVGNPAYNIRLIETEYLLDASAGLEDFYRLKIKNEAELVTTVDTLFSYYQTLDIYTYNPAALRPQLLQMFNQFSQWSDDAEPLDVYFVIGRMSSAGTVSNRGILVGAEQLAKIAPPDLVAQGYKFASLDLLVQLIAHEYVHSFQQQAGPGTLIRAAIFEGGADFLAELSTGISPMVKLHYQYGTENEQEVWHRFSQQMNSTDVSNWIANQKKGSRPGDLGYYVGYQIAKKFYYNMADKREAFTLLTTVPDANYILQVSGYAREEKTQNH
ncbi:DUF2268 domain-containing putative Zn-dependent protease [Paraglaciecola sp. 20A4]|uniref:DUF2268 domain-containing putative Zn-dependent protease n=1 Tax=Paraglaciecola sp. 20A4 TaxID=2687288 RepID=UPI00140CB4A7